MPYRGKSVFVCLLLVSACLYFQARRGEPAQRPPAKAEALQGEAAIQQLKSDGGYASLSAAMAAARYRINAASTQSGHSGAPFYANNPGQRLRATFAPDEVRVDAASNKTSGKTGRAELRLRLVGYGYGDQLESLAAGKLTTNGDRIEILKSQVSNPKSEITEWYVNKPEGLEQGFTLAAPPAGGKPGEWLRVAMSVGAPDSGWRANLRGDQQGAFFERQADGLRLIYDHLAAYDARGRALPARMALDGDKLALLVDDAQAIYPLTIDPLITQQRKLTAAARPNGARDDIFGVAVALSGNTAVIGAPFDDVTGTNEGSAYVFVRSGTSWSSQQKLTANDGANFDNFGASVAISGDTVVVGAPHGANVNQGSAYVFTRSGTVWTQQLELTANDGADGDEFGRSVALNDDTVVVGARFADIGANADQGSVYVFIRSGTTQGAIWTQRQKLTAGDGSARDAFGASVALSGDTIVVGAWGGADIGANPDQGSAYVFTRSGAAQGATWTQQQKLTAGDGARRDEFGASVAISGDTLVVGAPRWTQELNQGAAYVFARNGAVWSQQRRLFAEDGAAGGGFGSAVALSGDTVLAGAATANGVVAVSGAAYVFVIGENYYVQRQSITAPDGMASDHFGHAVALSGDTVVVGVPEDDDFSVNQGSAYVFIRSGDSRMLQQALVSMGPRADDAFGFSVAISGDTIVVGSTKCCDNGSAGAVYIFTRSGNTWREQQRLTAADGVIDDLFGYSVAISGNTVVVGAQGVRGANFNVGAAYVFIRSGITWTQQAKLFAFDAAADAFFGHSVAISGDMVVVGAPGADIGANVNQGAAYVFTRSGATWQQGQKIGVNDGAARDGFGSSLAIGGDTLVVGAPFDDIGAKADQGSVYVLARLSNGWTLQSQLIDNGGASGDDFGHSVAISGDTVVVGALLDDVNGNIDQGSAYVFTRNGVFWTQQRLTANDGAAGDLFGCAVAISGGAVVVGALFDTVDSNSAQGSASVFVNPACPGTTLAPATLPGAKIGASYNQTVTASSVGGGVGPYQFSLSGGSLPPGLSLAQNGRLSGAPTTAGTYSFTITATIPGNLCPGSRSYTMNVQPNCPPFTISPTSQNVTAAGGAGSINVTGNAGCPWTAVSNVPWILFGNSSGAGNGTAEFAVGANNGAARAGQILVAGQTFTVNQAAFNCAFSLSPTSMIVTTFGGPGAVDVTTQSGCAWTAVSNVPWITITSGASGAGAGAVRFAGASNPNPAARRGTLTVAGRGMTVAQAPAIACVSAASFVRGALASESIVAAFGAGLAQSTEVATEQPLPTTLAGTRVSVMDSLGAERDASLFFVSPTQINFQVPPGTAAGKALVTIIHEDEMVAAGAPQIEIVSPGLFSADASGQGLMIGVALRVKADGSQLFEPIVRFDDEKRQFVAAPIDLGAATDRVFLVLFATGVRYRSALSAVSVKIGGVNTDALYAGPQGDFVGLDQLNVALPRSLAGRGDVEVFVMVDGKESNALKVSIK